MKWDLVVKHFIFISTRSNLLSRYPDLSCNVQGKKHIMAHFSLTRVRLEKILRTIMFTIIAGSEFMIAVIVVRSESSKTLVTSNTE